ncbi:MAG: DUF2780 domain-containing protein [Pseudomonadota bacterium]
MIDQLIARIVEQIGLDRGVAEQALGSLLGLLQKEGDGAAVSQLFDAVPGAADLASKFGGGSGGGGLLGGVAGALSGVLGDKAGSAFSAVAALQNSGLDMDQAKSMMPVVAGFLKENAGEGALMNALESVPALKDLLN